MVDAPAPFPTAGLLRRLAAMLYDGLLLLALFMIATAGLLALTGGEAIPAGHAAYRTVLIAIIWGFFAWFWRRGGSTLGMQAWRMRLVSSDGGPLRGSQLLRRLLAATVSWLLFGAGYLWLLVDREGLAWPDRFSGTRPVILPRR
jgi:uncharacterized RDD family membrane protein YckC